MNKGPVHAIHRALSSLGPCLPNRVPPLAVSGGGSAMVPCSWEALAECDGLEVDVFDLQGQEVKEEDLRSKLMSAWSSSSHRTASSSSSASSKSFAAWSNVVQFFF